MSGVGIRDDKMGPVLDFHVCFGKVLSDDAETEELQAADEYDHADRGSPAGDGVSPDQPPHHDKDQKQEGNTGHDHAEPGGDTQRSLGEIDTQINDPILNNSAVLFIFFIIYPLFIYII